MQTQSGPTQLFGSDARTLYTERAIAGSTFLGGPLAGCCLLAHNFRNLGKVDATRWAYVLGISATISIPFLSAISNKLLPDSITKWLYFLWQIPIILVFRTQMKDPVSRHLSAGGKKGSGWMAAGIGLTSLLITFLYVLIQTYATEKTIAPIPAFTRSMAHLEHGTIYFDSTTISRSDAKTIGLIFESQNYFYLGNQQFVAFYYVQEGIYTIAIPVKKIPSPSSEVHSAWHQVLHDLKGVFSTRKHQIRLLLIESSSIQDELVVGPD